MLATSADPQLQQQRNYAAPVNSSSSVDSFLGTSPPAPPRPLSEEETRAQTDPRAAAENASAAASTTAAAQELARILKGGARSGGSNGPTRSPGGRGITREGLQNDPLGLQRSAILSELKGKAVARRKEDMPPPQQGKVAREEKAQPVDREHPHAIDAMNGRNELDERVLAAAKALQRYRQQSRGLSPDNAIQSLSSLWHQYDARAYLQLSIELAAEPNPDEGRRAPLTSASSTDADLLAAQDDGVLLIAYVSGLGDSNAVQRGSERISLCSGFAVKGGDMMPLEDDDIAGAGKGALLVTCAHTLQAAAPKGQKRKGESGPFESQSRPPQDENSVAFAITRTGKIYPIVKLVSSLPTCDIILYQLAEHPFSAAGSPTGESSFDLSQPSSQRSIRTLPVSPYPAVVGTQLAISSFWGWEDDSGAVLPAWYFDDSTQSSSSPSRFPLTLESSTPKPPAGREKEKVEAERDDAPRSRWGRARLVEYKDRSGMEANTGTYDDLHQMDFKLLSTSPENPPALQDLRLTAPLQDNAAEHKIAKSRRAGLASFPPPGSSGGPVVDVETGAVVGVVRGTKMSLMEGKRGDAIPAEKIFECEWDRAASNLKSKFDLTMLVFPHAVFALPGMGKKIREERARMKKAQENASKSQ